MDNGNLLAQFDHLIARAPQNVSVVQQPQAAQVQVPRDIKWVTKSSEYVALCVQTYRNATNAVRDSAQSQRQGKWVVVLDVDETVVDNSQYQIERNALGSGFTLESWDAWVKRREAKTIPGAKAFLDIVRNLGGHVAFITDRNTQQEQATIENMKREGLFVDGDIILTKSGKDDTKEIRRQCLTSGAGRCQNYGPLSIAALLGDQIKDFMEVEGADEIRELRQKILSDPNWGRRYFMLPNPMYGKWEKLPQKSGA